mgnify:CR=1 FL=1
MLLIIANRKKDVYFLTQYGFFIGYNMALRFNSIEEAKEVYKSVKFKPNGSYTIGIYRDAGNKNYLKEDYIEKL